MGEKGRVEGRATAWLVLVVTHLSFSTAQAQEMGRPPLGIDHFGLEEGLPGLYVPDLTITTDGQLWLIASNHLVSFDGFEFVDHDLAAFETSDRALHAISAGRADTLWVTTGDRVFSYVRGGVPIGSDLISGGQAMWQVGDTTLSWSFEGIRRYVGGEEEIVVPLAYRWHMGDTADHRPGAPGNLWLHVPGQGAIARLSARQVHGPLPFPEAWPLPDPGRSTLISRAGPEVTEVTRLDGSHVTTIPREVGDWPALVDSRGLIWLRSQGAAIAAEPSGEVAYSFPLPADALISAIVEDGEGNVWLGTVTHGVYRIRSLAVRTMGAAQGVTDEQVRRVTAGSSGSVLALSALGGLTRISDSGVEQLLAPSGLGQVFGAIGDRRGTTWVSLARGTEARLVGFQSDGTLIDIPVDVTGRPIEDPTEEGGLWVNRDGIAKIDQYAEGGPTVAGPYLDRTWDIRDMIAGPDGDVWATGSNGLVHITRAGVAEVVDGEDQPLAAGRALYLDAEGVLWIGLAVDGLVRYKDGEFRQITRADGLWDTGTSTVMEDDDGNLWMSSNRGVHRVLLREANAFLDGEVDRVQGWGYGPGSGFQNPETSGFPGYRDPSGRLWFPTFSGVAVVDPMEVTAQAQSAPLIRIRGVQPEGGSLIPDSVVLLPRGVRRADVGYGAILLTGHDGIRYEVRLDGVDADWTDAGAQRQVSYGNLPPGRHVFRARAVSGAGVRSLQEASVTLVVPAYFHETSSFAVLMAMLMGTALWAFYQMRVRQHRQRETELQALVSERTRDLQGALVTVEAQATQLRSLDEAKSRFFANVSHELRTPLTLVQGPLQDVLDGRLGPTPQPVREQVETVLASGRRLGELVEQLLDVAKLEAGELRVNVRREDLSPLFERMVAAFGALARGRDISFAPSVPSGSILASVDADQMEKVWTNLLANALKFTPAGGRVRLIVEAVQDALVVTVEDNGPGIPVEELAPIFERFHQVDSSSSRVHGGTGLGLALVKEVTELHGGTVEVSSEPDRGSRFVVRVPADAVVGGSLSDHVVAPVSLTDPSSATSATAAAPTSPASPAAASPSQTAGQTPAQVRSHAPDSTEPDIAAEAPSETDTDAAAERMTVLVVEDNDELRAYLRRHLQDRYNVVEARNGREGLEVAREVVPDLILCDLMMPEMDGNELCRAVRADPELAFLPVVMVTARSARESRLSALEGGADDFVTKPFDPAELRLRIDNLFAGRRRLAERLREEGASLPFVDFVRPGNGGDRDFATRLEEVLRENMANEDFDVEAMSKALSMSRATLYRKVDEAFGTSPKEVIWGYRLDQAAHWLRETNATVSEAAYGAGFKTVPHFTRRFKERFGQSPTAWRKAR